MRLRCTVASAGSLIYQVCSGPFTVFTHLPLDVLLFTLSSWISSGHGGRKNHKVSRWGDGKWRLSLANGSSGAKWLPMCDLSADIRAEGERLHTTRASLTLAFCLDNRLHIRPELTQKKELRQWMKLQSRLLVKHTDGYQMAQEPFRPHCQLFTSATHWRTTAEFRVHTTLALHLESEKKLVQLLLTEKRPSEQVSFGLHNIRSRIWATPFLQTASPKDGSLQWKCSWPSIQTCRKLTPQLGARLLWPASDNFWRKNTQPGSGNTLDVYLIYFQMFEFVPNKADPSSALMHRREVYFIPSIRQWMSNLHDNHTHRSGHKLCRKYLFTAQYPPPPHSFFFHPHSTD